MAWASYGSREGTPVTLSIEEVIGAPLVACSMPARIRARRACVETSPSVRIVWVLGDALRVALVGDDEAMLRRIATTLDLAPLAQLATSMRVSSMSMLTPAAELDPEEQEPAIVSAEPLPPRLLSLRAPRLPRGVSASGPVSVRVEVAASGAVTAAQVVGPDTPLSALAVDAARAARFAPAQDVRGHAIDDVIIVRVELAPPAPGRSRHDGAR